MVRLGLWALCGVEAVLGVWTQFFPHSFYTTVPHFVVHVSHLHHFSIAESVVLTAVLAASVVVAAGLLIVHVVETRRDSHDLRHPVLG